MMLRWFITGILTAVVAAWAWRSMNPRPALAFILLITALLWALAATASTFGMGLSHWSYRQNQRSRP